jgi:hypothetical protein
MLGRSVLRPYMRISDIVAIGLLLRSFASLGMTTPFLLNGLPTGRSILEQTKSADGNKKGAANGRALLFCLVELEDYRVLLMSGTSTPSAVARSIW